MTDVIHLSTDALVKAINDEYSIILVSERSNLQKALAIGEKLKALRSRTDHGEWQVKLAEFCPKLSYETATLYVRLWDNQSKLADAAAEKSVEPTDMTIDDFRRYLAKPKGDKAAKTVAKSNKVLKAGVEPAMDPKPRSLPPDDIVRELEAGELFDILMSVYEQDRLVDLATRLAQHLRMTLVPKTQVAA